jgi:hypothetical protein
MAEGGHRARLPLEAGKPLREPLGVAAHPLGQDLDRDLAPQAGVESAVHLPHPPGLVRPQPRTRGEGHGGALRNQ